MLKLVWIFLGVYTSRWETEICIVKKIPSYEPDDVIDVNVVSFRLDFIMAYSFYNIKGSQIQTCCNKISTDYKNYMNIAFKRSQTSEKSLLQNISRHYPHCLSEFPSDVLMMNIIHTDNKSDGPPVVELTTIGGSDYAMYEVEGEKVKLVRNQPRGTFVFTDQAYHAGLNEKRPIIEIRFPLRHRSYFVLGSASFWSLMSTERIAPLLEASETLQ